MLSIEREAHSGDVDGDDDDALSKRIVSKKGHLKKQPMTSKFQQKWQDRFFVLDNDKLSYYQVCAVQ